MKTNTQKITDAIESNEARLDEWIERTAAIAARVPGWSRHFHYLFFKSVFDALPAAQTVLILGVYMGRDITLMFDAVGKHRSLMVVGVDKFNALPCDDWPEEKRGMTWEQAFFCPPPDIDAAAANIGAKPPHSVQLIKANDKEWLEGATGAFDLIFLDASHEYASINRQIRACHKLCHPFTVVSGDDYANVQPGWGVEDAVKQAFKTHQHIDNRIWFAGAEDYL